MYPPILSIIIYTNKIIEATRLQLYTKYILNIIV